MEVVDELFFVEGDVLLQKNPFKLELFQGYDGNNRPNGKKYDIMYQREVSHTNECNNDVNDINAGVYYFRKSKELLLYLNHVSYSNETRFKMYGNNKFDMDFEKEIMNKYNLTRL